MTTANCWHDATPYDFRQICDDLVRLLRIKATPIGMKRFETREELEEIPRLRFPDPALKLATDQIVAQARWIGYTIGFTMDHLMGAQCGAVIGLHPRDEEWRSGNQFNGVWYGSLEDSAAHQGAMDCASYGDYEAMVVSPLTSGRIDNPDVCLIYATPGQMITLINGYQYRDYKKCSFSVVGESACADSWGRALKTGELSVSIPCYAERKFGGVQDDELLVALPPSDLPKIVLGLEALNKSGLRYPIPNHGIQLSPAASMAQSYGTRTS